MCDSVGSMNSVTSDGRLFVRSWNDKPTGWFRAFRKQPTGRLQLATLEIPVRGKPVRSSRIRDAVTKAFGEEIQHERIAAMGEGLC
jgi:hypothetical protein